MTDLATAAAFADSMPSRLTADLTVVLDALPGSNIPPHTASAWRVVLGSEAVCLPYRMYCPELPASDIDRLSQRQREIAACLFTRHNDGHVRDRYVRLALDSAEDFVVPFVFALIGEYVVEIIEAIRERLEPLEDAAHLRHYRDFASANPEYIRLVVERGTSYWNCYYRSAYPRASQYPGRVLARLLTAQPE